MRALRVAANRFEEFRIANALAPRTWYPAAKMSRAAFRVVRLGSDPYLATARRLVVAGSILLGRQVRAHELWDVGEDEPLPTASALASRPFIAKRHLATLKRYDTAFDRVLHAEGLSPFFFAQAAAISRQHLQRLRSGENEPCMSTVAQIVRTLRRLTGKPYKAAHIFEVGEQLPTTDALVLWLRRSL